jgi:putative restriction endonuclease
MTSGEGDFTLEVAAPGMLSYRMASGKRWTRDELLIVLNLYHKLRFGQFHARQAAVIDLAKRMDRNPASVAMKLCNFASFDPALQLRGIKGLQGASKLDREIWDEFHANPAELVPLTQQRFDSLFVQSDHEVAEVIPGQGIRIVRRPPAGDTEVQTVTRQRRGQDYFRDVVLNNFGGRCGITGLPIRELLVASHILPWSTHEAERLNVRNGICLNRLHDAAFDQHLIGFDDDLRLLLSTRLKSALPDPAVRSQFEALEGTTLAIPEDGMAPDPGFLRLHREKVA